MPFLGWLRLTHWWRWSVVLLQPTSWARMTRASCTMVLWPVWLPSAGSDVVHPVRCTDHWRLVPESFLSNYSLTPKTNWKWMMCSVFWPLHGVCGSFGGLAVGLILRTAMARRFGRCFNPSSQLIGTLLAISIALVGGFFVYGVLKLIMGIRLSQEDMNSVVPICLFIKFQPNSQETIF